MLQIFHYFGADQKILTDAHPHIGTNKLPKIINNMCEKIISLGGEIHFNTKVIDFILSNDNKTFSSTNEPFQNSPNSPRKKIIGTITKNVLTGEKKSFYADSVLLATGHSATDIYHILAKIAPESLEAKTFAVGVRVEHPRSLIDKIQYHSNNSENLRGNES